jgi:YggT family protein
MGSAMIQTVGHALDMILNMMQILIFVSVAASLLGGDPGNPIVNFIQRATEPIYRPFRKLTRNIPGPFDWAPFIVLVIIVSVQRGIVYRMKSGLF